VDFLYRNSDGPFGEIMTGRFWGQASDSSDLDGDDTAFGINLEIPSDKLSAYVDLQQIDENFRPALGFVNRAGIRQYDTGMRYRTRPETGFWRAVNHRFDYTLVTDMDDRKISQSLAIEPIGLYSNRDDYMFLRLSRKNETVTEEFDLFDRLGIPVGDYEFDRYRAEIRTGMQRPLRFVAAVEDGGFFGGDRLEKHVEVQWRQSAYFFLGVAFTENVVDLPTGSFTSHLASLKTDIAFNSRWSWSNLVQYDNTADAAALNSRLRYIPEAGREVLLVFNHGAAVGMDNRLTSTRSDVNLKLSYTFRY